MTNQKQTKMRRIGFLKLVTVALVLAAMLCCFSILTSADEAPAMSLADHFTIGMTNANGAYEKTYDGTTDADITLNDAGRAQLSAMMTALSPEELLLVDLDVAASFNSANVAEATEITVTFTAVAKDDTAAAQDAVAKATKDLPDPIVLPGKIAPKALAWNYATGSSVALNGQYVAGQSAYSFTLNAADLPALAIENAPAFAEPTVSVTIQNVQASNLGTAFAQTVTVALADPNYVAEPLQVTATFKPIEITKIVWNGNEAASKPTFTYGDANAYQLSAVGVAADGTSYPLTVVYPTVYGDAGVYTNVGVTAPAGCVFASGVSTTTTVTITPIVYTVWMDSASYIGNAGQQATPTVYSLTVNGDLPAEIRALIQYTNNAQSEYGSYAVVATLPTNANYSFVDRDGEAVTALNATLQIKRQFILAENQELPYQVVLSSPNGLLGEVSATVTIPTDLPADLVADFPAYKAYLVQIEGTTGEKLMLTISISKDLFLEDCKPFDVSDLYIYNGSQLVSANTIEGYTVTLGDGFYRIEGVSANSSLTFVIAPTYEFTFWGSIWSILLIILLVLLVLITIMILIGLRLLRIRSEKQEEEEVEQEAAQEVATETEKEDEVDVEENLEEKVVEKAAVEELDDSVEAVAVVDEDDEADDDEDEDEEEDGEEEGEEESDSFAGFGSDDQLDFIDAVADAEKYELLLAAVARGEVRLVTRYRRSFQSRLCHAQGNVQDYYNEIKNLLLSYKGVKNRVSWNYEAFNCGRAHVAKMNVKTKTLYLYLALDPAALADTKYGIVDMSSKKKYATVPVLLKIKGERKFKYALELIAKLCGEDMALKQLDVANTDYKPTHQSTEELVEAGYIKKMVAGVPIDD